MLQAFFDSDQVDVSVTSPPVVGVTRTYNSFSEMMKEGVGNARIWGGSIFAARSMMGSKLAARLGRRRTDFPRPRQLTERDVSQPMRALVSGRLGRTAPVPITGLSGTCAMIDPDRFIADCLAAQAADTSFRHVCEIVARAVADPALILRRASASPSAQPCRSSIMRLLTILNVILAPGMTIPPHDHRMRAVIGVYTGCEDNIFWQRIKGGQGGKLEAIGAKALRSSDAELLDANMVHSVSNPLARLTGAIHVYDGDFFASRARMGSRNAPRASI